MLYTAHGKNFKHHVHPRLQRRLRLFFILSAVMLLLALLDIYHGILSIQWAVVSIIVGGCVGIITSRVFKLSWKKDGEMVVGQIDTLGWIILALYIGFEILRATVFSTVFHVSDDASTAITYMFVSSALISRAFGLRGRMIKVMKQEKVFD